MAFFITSSISAAVTMEAVKARASRTLAADLIRWSFMLDERDDAIDE
jgi:hypothetical protein